MSLGFDSIFNPFHIKMTPVYSLSELNRHIRQTMEDAYPDAIWVSAEIASFNLNSYSGHCYLELVDADGQQAKMKAMIWKKTFEIIRSKFEVRTGISLKSGIRVQFLVKIEFNVQYGLSLIVWDIDPDFTIGEQAKNRALVVKRLGDEGLLEVNKSRFLEAPVQRLAIISSASAAGLQDFMVHLSENEYGYAFQTQLFPAIMQGSETTSSVGKALKEIQMNLSQFQAVVLIRGGGSALDLQAFDEYELAASLAQFPLPVFSGIGHQRDETVCDLVAHTRFKTPTAVADWLIANLIQCDQSIFELVQDIAQNISWRLNDFEEAFSKINFSLTKGFYKSFQTAQIQRNSIFMQLNSAFQKAVFQERESFQLIASQISEGNPIRIFEKGFVRVSQKDKVIRRKALANPNETFTLQWIDGTLNLKTE